jgi:membrane associated rhomboid family serine protease
VGFLLLTPDFPVTGVVGASGAIFGLFGAMLVIQRHRGGETKQLWVLMAINGAIGFIVPGIAWQAHLGGAVTGAPRQSLTRQGDLGEPSYRPEPLCWSWRSSLW